MRTQPSWQFDEFEQVGRDYDTDREVEIYDETHAQFRDIDSENRKVLTSLALPAGATLIDIGCGTGHFAIEAAKHGLHVHAADVSGKMLERAERKSLGVAIAFHHAGFLTLEMPSESMDAITSTFAFHHLPDFWKGIALHRLAKMLKTGGTLYLKDVILLEQNAEANIAALISQQEALGGDFLREDAEGHFKSENSTYDWVIEGLLDRAGFSIKDRSFEGGVIGTYLCGKL